MVQKTFLCSFALGCLFVLSLASSAFALNDETRLATVWGSGVSNNHDGKEHPWRFFPLSDGNTLIQEFSTAKSNGHSRVTLVNQLGESREVADPNRELLAVDCDPQAGCFALITAPNQKTSRYGSFWKCKQLVRYNPTTGETQTILNSISVKDGKLQTGKQKCSRLKPDVSLLDAYASLIIQRGETETEPIIFVSCGGYLFRFQANGVGKTIHDPYKLLRKSRNWDDTPVLLAGWLSYSSDENLTAVVFPEGEEKLKGLSINRAGQITEQDWAVPTHAFDEASPLLYHLDQDGTAEILTTQSVLRCTAPKGCVEAYKLAAPTPFERPTLGFTNNSCGAAACRKNQFVGDTVYNAEGASLRELTERIRGYAPALCTGARAAYSYIDSVDTYESEDPGANFFYGGFQGFRRSGELLFGDSCRRVVRAFVPSNHPRLSRVLAFKPITASNLTDNKLPVDIPETGTAELTVHKTVQPYDKLEQSYAPEGVDTPLDLQFSAKLTRESPYIDLPTTLTPGVYSLSLIFTGESGAVLSAKRNLYVGISAESFLPKFLENQVRTIYFAGEPEEESMRGAAQKVLHNAKRSSMSVLHSLVVRGQDAADPADDPLFVSCYRGKRTGVFDGQDPRNTTCELGFRITVKRKIRKKIVTVRYEGFIPFRVAVLNPDEVTILPLGEYFWVRTCLKKKSVETCHMKKEDKIT